LGTPTSSPAEDTLGALIERTTYLPAILAGHANGLPLIELLPDANSGKLHQLSRARGFVVVAPKTQIIARGEEVRWRPFEG
jgi:molybdopterin molybdotransferase